MDRENPTTPATRRQRRPATKPSGPPTKNVALQLKLPPEVKRWLEVQALGRGINVSALVVELVRQQPTEFVLSKRGQGAAAEPKPLAIAEAG